MAFYGYLIQIGNTPLPMEYMKAESYSITPDQRMETEAKRSSDGVLHRATVEHKPVKIEFETPIMTNNQMDGLRSVLSSAFANTERKLNIQYYDPETNSYKSATCYMPDSKYSILKVDGNIIYYNSIRFAFIEY